VHLAFEISSIFFRGCVRYFVVALLILLLNDETGCSSCLRSLSVYVVSGFEKLSAVFCISAANKIVKNSKMFWRLLLLREN